MRVVGGGNGGDGGGSGGGASNFLKSVDEHGNSNNDTGMASLERRIDPSDGGAYTRAEFIQFYGGTAQWDAALRQQLSASSSSVAASNGASVRADSFASGMAALSTPTTDGGSLPWQPQQHDDYPALSSSSTGQAGGVGDTTRPKASDSMRSEGEWARQAAIHGGQPSPNAVASAPPLPQLKLSFDQAAALFAAGAVRVAVVHCVSWVDRPNDTIAPLAHHEMSMSAAVSECRELSVCARMTILISHT